MSCGILVLGPKTKDTYRHDEASYVGTDSSLSIEPLLLLPEKITGINLCLTYKKSHMTQFSIEK